jgi:ribosomal RNA-processing protein 12
MFEKQISLAQSLINSDCEFAIGMFEKQISLAQSLINSDSNCSETEVTHMLGAMIVLVPYLLNKAMKRMFLGAYQLLSPCFTPINEAKADKIESEVETFVS